MNNKPTPIKKFLLSFLTIGIVSSGSISASATPPGVTLDSERNWHFGCYPETETQIGQFPPPNILLMLDASGSMQDKDPGEKRSRLLRAKYALLELIETNHHSTPPIAYFGFGYYPSHERSSYRDPWAVVKVGCSANNFNSLDRSIRTQQASGHTPTHDAVKVAAQDACNTVLQKNQSSATAVITDGVPNNRQTTIAETCKHRRVSPVYTIGLGNGTDIMFNDLMAAAGGTGECLHRGQNWDPCDHMSELSQYNFNTTYLDDIQCSGSYNTTATDELLNALRGIAAKVACVFPLETAGIDPDKIPVDPSNKYPFVKVNLQMGGADRVLTYNEDTSSSQSRRNQKEGWTWKFTNSQKNSVSLGKAACSAIKQQKVTSVKTQLGCICLQPPGTKCGGERIKEVEVCPPGTFMCDRGLDECKTNTQSQTTTLACRTALTGICSFGHYECVNGTAQCLPNNRPMPELCDGVDNDCDGDEDNIDTSWKKPAFVAEVKKVEALQTPAQREELGPPSTYKDYRLRACEGKNLCVCPTLKAKVVEVPMSSADLDKQYSSYVEYWSRQHGDCHCQAI